MARKKKGCEYSKSDSFENLEAIQEMALNRKGKDDEVMEAYIEVYNRIIPDEEKVI